MLRPVGDVDALSTPSLRARAGSRSAPRASRRRASSAPMRARRRRARRRAPRGSSRTRRGGRPGRGGQPPLRPAWRGRRRACGSRRPARRAARARRRRSPRRPASASARQSVHDARVVGARLQRQRALADRRQHALGVEPLGDARREPQAVEPGAGEHAPRRRRPRRPCAAACRRCRAGCSIDRSARTARTWQTRRRLDVPTRLPAGSAPSPRPTRLTMRVARIGARRDGDDAPARRASSAGTSFRLCTARSIVAAPAAPSSISLTQTPLPPSIDHRARSARGRPAVTMIFSRTSRPGCAARSRRPISRRLPARERAAARADDERAGRALIDPAAFLSDASPVRLRASGLSASASTGAAAAISSANSRCTRQHQRDAVVGVVVAQRHLRQVQQLLGEALGQFDDRAPFALAEPGASPR